MGRRWIFFFFLLSITISNWARDDYSAEGTCIGVPFFYCCSSEQFLTVFLVIPLRLASSRQRSL